MNKAMTTKEKGIYLDKSNLHNWFTFREIMTLVVWQFSKKKREMFWKYADMGMHAHAAFKSAKKEITNE